jgi:hypothetical protein
MKMAVELLTFDPDGDLLLILTDSLDFEDPTESRGKDDRTIDRTATENFQEQLASMRLSGVESSPIEPSPPDLEGPKSQREIHMLVSSKHLMLASPVFRAMFQCSNFQEGDALRSSGKVKVPLPDDDPAALKILLDIVHGRVRQVPRQVNLQIMTDLSVLVDKYQMLEVVELYAEIWMSTLKMSVPMFFTADLLPWLSISWVFGLAEQFKQITRIAMRGSTDKLGAHVSHLFLRAILPTSHVSRVVYSLSKYCTKSRRLTRDYLNSILSNTDPRSRGLGRVSSNTTTCVW